MKDRRKAAASSTSSRNLSIILPGCRKDVFPEIMHPPAGAGVTCFLWSLPPSRPPIRPGTARSFHGRMERPIPLHRKTVNWFRELTYAAGFVKISSRFDAVSRGIQCLPRQPVATTVSSSSENDRSRVSPRSGFNPAEAIECYSFFLQEQRFPDRPGSVTHTLRAAGQV